MCAGIDLLDELMQSLLGAAAAARTTYAESFQKCIGLCPHNATIEELKTAAKQSGWLGSIADESPDDLPTLRDEYLNFLLATRVEPHLGQDRPEVIYHYPATQASLSRVARSPLGYDVAERFELYVRGIELANGFHELTNPAELRRRLDAVNASRIASRRPALPMPNRLLTAMEHGLPDCTGCALGFDRLAMLATGATTISEVRSFLDGVV
jgi:lysyl-tRNA synthetase class 2